MLADVKFRLRALFRRDAMERELDDELRFHLEHEIEKYVRQGMPRAEAERRARIAFGGVDRIKDDARDARGITVIDALLQDLRYGWRGLRSRPGFTAAVVVTLALGIGANTAMFGILDRLMFRAPAYLRSPERVHRVYVGYVDGGSERLDYTISYTQYLDLTRWTPSFERTAVTAYRDIAVGAGEDAREMRMAAVSATFFDLFDARPVLGRYFTTDDDRTPFGTRVVVLSEGLWRSRYDGRRDVLGDQLYVGSASYTIIGVAPAGFVGITDDAAPVAFVPVTAVAGQRNQSYYRSYGWSWLHMFARRKAGVSVDRATADLSVAAERSWEAENREQPLPPASVARPRGLAGHVLLGRGPAASADSRVVTWVSGVAIIVLLIACANVANLLLARAVRRRREISLRLALGVTRARLMQQLMTEGLLLAAFGGIAGLVAAQWGGETLRALFLREEDVGAVISDTRTILFAAAITLAVALVTGLAPMVHAFRGDVAGSLKAGARDGTYRRSRMRTGLLLLQGALSVVLLVGAGLFVRSLDNVRTLRLGYDVEPIVFVQGNLRGTRLSVAEEHALDARLLSAARRVPGVSAASLTISVPFWSNEGRGLWVPGVDSVHKRGRFLLQAGSPSYFETMGTRILRGRGFGPEDRLGSPLVVVVSEGMARALWPGQDAIGQVMRIGSDTAAFTTVVGVAENMKARLLRDEREFWYYVPIAQHGPSDPSLFVRANGRAEDIVEAVRRRLQQEMPGTGYVTATPLRNMVDGTQRSWQFGATMFVAFGGLALVLAAIGLYSVIAYSVAQRTHELGVRIALGASVRDVIRMVVGQGMSFAAAGIAIGSLIALWAGRWVEPLLFSQSAKDPAVFAGVAVVLLLVALVATLRPAIRATRVDPTVALRSD